jgi:hypothetical protein
LISDARPPSRERAFRFCASLGRRRVWLGAAAVVLLTETCIMAQSPAPSPGSDITKVLDRHRAELMALPDVVGVYIGLADDGKTPSIRVMLERESPDARRAIPRQIEHHPVLVEVSGEIRPLEHP